QLQRRQSLSGSQDHQDMFNIAFWCTSRQSLLILSKAGNLTNKGIISLSLKKKARSWCLGLGDKEAFLNKQHKPQFILQHRFSSRLSVHTPRFAFTAKRLQALQK
ncbi:hypothetical protein M959_00267, partial [Chaetura pelagica]